MNEKNGRIGLPKSRPAIGDEGVAEDPTPARREPVFGFLNKADFSAVQIPIDGVELSHDTLCPFRAQPVGIVENFQPGDEHHCYLSSDDFRIVGTAV
jgi:hypothetical protein